MEMRNRAFWFLFCSLFLLLPGCAHVISKDIRAEVDFIVSFPQVLQDPDAYKGKTVLWGGEIV